VSDRLLNFRHDTGNSIVGHGMLLILLFLYEPFNFRFVLVCPTAHAFYVVDSQIGYVVFFWCGIEKQMKDLARKGLRLWRNRYISLG